MQEETMNMKLLDGGGISITAVTWNLFGSLPPINSLVQLAASDYFAPKPHLILFGTQQCERDLWVTLCCEGKQNWEAMLRQAFRDYELVASLQMRGMHSAILVIKTHREDIQIYRTNKLKAGALGCMGTKGAISIILVFMGQLLQFINCHLAASQNENEKRNATIESILEQIVEKQKKCEVIFLGDFNYRIDIASRDYERMQIGKKSNSEASMHYSALLQKDQLGRQKDLKLNFLSKFQEGTINFPPTYKLGVFDDEYNRERIPGWTDRIFHRHSPNLNRILYGCQYDIKGCDHRPVMARYNKQVRQQSFNVVGQIKNDGSCQLI